MKYKIKVCAIALLLFCAGCERKNQKCTETIDLERHLGLEAATHVLNMTRQKGECQYWLRPLSLTEKKLYRRKLSKIRIFISRHQEALVNHERDAYIRFYANGKPTGPWFFQRWRIPYPPKFKDVGIGIVDENSGVLHILVSQSKTSELPYGSGGETYKPTQQDVLPSNITSSLNATYLPFDY